MTKENVIRIRDTFKDAGVKIQVFGDNSNVYDERYDVLIWDDTNELLYVIQRVKTASVFEYPDKDSAAYYSILEYEIIQYMQAISNFNQLKQVLPSFGTVNQVRRESIINWVGEMVPKRNDTKPATKSKKEVISERPELYDSIYAGEDERVRIGSSYFENLEDAINAADPGDVITFVKDIQQEQGVIINKELTIDLNEKTFEVVNGANANNRAIKVTGSSDFTIKNGTIIAQGSGTTKANGTGCYGAVRFESSGTLSMTGLTLKNSRPWGMNVKIMKGMAILNNVKISSSYGGCLECAGATATLNNCRFTQIGYFDHASSCVAVSSMSSPGKVIINGGTYKTENYSLYVYSSGGCFEVNEGVFNGTKGSLKTDLDESSYSSGIVDVKLNNGMFTGLIIKGPASEKKSIVITGGSYIDSPMPYVDKSLNPGGSRKYNVYRLNPNSYIVSATKPKGFAWAPAKEPIQVGYDYKML